MFQQGKKIMVFGVFDGLHPGHIDFLKQAGKYGDVVAVVARDSFVFSFKGKIPYEDEWKRLEEVRKMAFVKEAILADEIIGSYEVIKEHKPDMICLGYDQDLLEKDLNERMNAGAILRVPIIRLEAYNPEKFHSSILIGAKYMEAKPPYGGLASF